MSTELACLWVIFTVIVCAFAIEGGTRSIKWLAQKIGRWVADAIWGSGRPR